MRETGEKYTDNRFERKGASFDFSDSKIELTMKKGEVLSGTFQISSMDEIPVNGCIYANNPRMICDKKEFQGNEIIIGYEFDGVGLEEENVVKGEFHVVSNKGEYSLPFTVAIVRTAIETSLGQVKNLFHFANLAKSNWKEAIRLFYSPDFSQILNGNDIRYFSTYKGLAKEFGNEQNVEEFLIEINKKQEIEYILNTNEIIVLHPEDVIREEIKITKNGWGYINLTVSTEGDFVKVEQGCLTENEFLGNRCNLSVYIYADMLHAGINYGKVCLQHQYGKYEILVKAVNESNTKDNKHRKEKELILQIMNYYMDFRMKKITTAAWITRTREIVDKLLHCHEKNPEYRLLQAHLLITRERYNEAKWVLDHVKEVLDDRDCKPEIYCYYLYLTTLYVREESYVNKQTEEIELIYIQHSDNWRIAWLLLYLREEYSKSPTKKWMLLEEQFMQNNYSPVLYIEAVYLVNANSSLLQKLEGFELQVLNFAVKKELLDMEVLPQIHYLMGHIKRYSKTLFRVLEYCYAQKKDTETLQGICELLIKSNKTEPECFKWYELGVEKQLRITKLYEYYMMSLSTNITKQLPKIVMMYFAYNCNLDYKKKAFLYANLIQFKDSMPEMFRSYREQMERFGEEQLLKGHINKDLAILYTEILPPVGMPERIAKLLAPLLFWQQIEVNDSRVKEIIVIHDKLKGETRYPVSNGKALVAIYSADHKIFVQDAEGNRYSNQDCYRLVLFLSPKDYARAMTAFDFDFLGLDIFICEGDNDYVVITEENTAQFLRLVKSEQIRGVYKKEIRTKLLHYYFDNDYIRELDSYLEEIIPDNMLPSERAEFVQFMVIRGMYDKAIAWIKTYGTEGIADKTLLRLCSRILIRNELEQDDFLLELCHISFVRERYDEYILEYLVNFYIGTTKELRDIWKAAENFDVDTFAISERIIEQMLFSHAFIGEEMEVFKSYNRIQAREDLKMSYLSHCAYEYFVDNKVMDSSLFKSLTTMIRDNMEVGTVCKLAYLKHFSEHPEDMSEEEQISIKAALEELWQQKIYFSFFTEFLDLFPQLELMLNHTILEYKTAENSRVWLHYVFEWEGKEKVTEYRKEEMKHIYGEIYAKSFLLFFGESIQYYITEEGNQTEELTESGIIRKNDITREQKENKFSIINDLAIAKTLQDYDTIQQLMGEYCKKEFLVNQLFQII